VAARCPGSQRRQGRRLAPVSVDVAAGASDVVLEMPEGARVGGRVTNADGSPAVRAVVVLLNADGCSLGRTRVEEDGGFELVVPKTAAGAPSGDASRGSLQLTVDGPSRGTLAHPQEHDTLRVEHVDLDGPELALQFPAQGD